MNNVKDILEEDKMVILKIFRVQVQIKEVQEAKPINSLSLLIYCRLELGPIYCRLDDKKNKK